MASVTPPERSLRDNPLVAHSVVRRGLAVLVIRRSLSSNLVDKGSVRRRELAVEE